MMPGPVAIAGRLTFGTAFFVGLTHVLRSNWATLQAWFGGSDRDMCSKCGMPGAPFESVVSRHGQLHCAPSSYIENVVHELWWAGCVLAVELCYALRLPSVEASVPLRLRRLHQPDRLPLLGRPHEEEEVMYFVCSRACVQWLARRQLALRAVALFRCPVRAPCYKIQFRKTDSTTIGTPAGKRTCVNYIMHW